jgi:hypothetical protein
MAAFHSARLAAHDCPLTSVGGRRIQAFWLQKSIQSPTDISSGGTGNLLGNDGTYQDRESVSSWAQVEGANSVDHFPYDPIFAELFQAGLDLILAIHGDWLFPRIIAGKRSYRQPGAR